MNRNWIILMQVQKSVWVRDYQIGDSRSTQIHWILKEKCYVEDMIFMRRSRGGGPDPPSNFWRFLKKRCFYPFYGHFYVFSLLGPPLRKSVGPHLRRKNGRTPPEKNVWIRA